MNQPRPHAKGLLSGYLLGEMNICQVRSNAPVHTTCDLLRTTPSGPLRHHGVRRRVAFRVIGTAVRERRERAPE
ncbi:hypothetical protein, partial [Mycobacteroides abscessus]|uniref:hypothetical protein n=1 Tax=Mycobacteroides abscessus TaxID=36809 RepID=UPI0019D1DD7E